MGEEVLSRVQPNYYGAGPALLPATVLERAALDLINYQNLGLGIGEISHRSKEATHVINETKRKIAELLKVPDTHEVFFLQGGGTGGFSCIVYNMLAAYASKHGKLGVPNYIVTGSWSAKALEEAARLGAKPHVVTNSKKVYGKYGSIAPESEWTFSDNAAYAYYCANETVNGVEFQDVPNVPEGVELVADMSSNFMSRPVDVSKFGLIFGGAQKNLGIAGISVYIAKKALLERIPDEELTKIGVPLGPIEFDFPTVVKNNSAYNTIPMVAVQVVNLYMDYLIANGGLETQTEQNIKKAEEIYSVLDSYPELFNLVVDKKYRSRMNVVFNIYGEGKEALFLESAQAFGLSGLKGHRSVGGIRASLYNAVTLESALLLRDFIRTFAEDVPKTVGGGTKSF